MGLFDLFFRQERPKFEIVADRIWESEAAKLQGIQLLADEYLRPKRKEVAAVMLVAQFPDTTGRLQAMVDASEHDSLRLIATAACSLPAVPPAELAFEESQAIEVIVAERHWLSRHDEELVAYFQAVRCRCRLSFHLSLDDALVRQSGIASIAEFDLSLISATQKEVEQKYRGQERGAISAAAWLEVNCPDRNEDSR